MLRDTWVTSEPLRITITPVCPGSRGCFQNDRRRSHRQGRGWAVIILAYAAQLFFHATATAASYADVQFSGLEALYNSTNGQGWTVSTGWRDSSIGVCSWYGVTCNGDASDKNVTGLSLPDNGLVGDISGAEELVNVTSLEEVDLSGNRLYGSVPRVFGLMPRLETLDLSGNELSSFPAAWGSGASALRHLFLQHNSISGSFPEAWLDANDSSAYPVVHLQSTSSWFPELRSLMLGANDMSSTGYSALQTVVRWRSLQILDLSDNALTGSVEDALTLYVCEGLGSAECGANTSSVGAPSLRVLKLDGNALTGQLPQVADSGGRRIDVLDISNNSGITGSIPVSYSELLMLFASDTGLSGSEIPFLGDDSTAGVWTHEEKDGLFVCPALEPSAGEDVVALSLDPSYDGYLTCVCDDGYNSSSGGCSECPLGTYRLAEEEEEERDDGLGGSCQACPSNSTTLQKGRWLRSQCVCSPNFYDGLAGGGSEPSCLACPSGSATASAGATNVTSCECGPGYTLNVTSSTCEACPAGTYKPAAGNHIELCLSCPPGSYSEAVGATSSSACEPCPLGSYGESYGADSSASCVECAAGTYGSVEGLNSQLLCTPCWAGHYSPTVGATSVSACIECPANFSQPNTGASASSDCLPCSGGEVADQGSAECVTELLEDGTLIGLYLLIAGIVLVVFTLAWVVLKKHYGVRIPVSQKVHMTLNDEMKAFIFGQQFWISLFSGVEIMDLMSDLGAYASLLYTAALTGAMKIVYTIVVAFALVASLHGVHTRAILILDMQEERRHGLAITGNNMLYYEKQFNILQIMTQKRTCRRHVPFDRGNKYLSHHISVQRLISLNSMRIIIAVFEDVPFLGLNMFLLLRQPHLAKNLVFMMSFVMSIFVLGYKMTLLEKHARLQIRKWNLEARMDTDTMLNKKAARGRRFSWACQQCKAEGISPEAQRESTRMLSAQIDGFAGTKRGSSSISREDERRASGGKRDSRSAGSDSSVSAGLNVNTTGGAKSVPAKVGEKTSAAAGKGNKQQDLPRGEGDDDDGGGGGGGRDGGGGGGTATPAAAAAPTATETDAKSKSCFSFGGGAKKSATTGGKRNDSEGRGGRRRQQNKVLPSEAADPDNDDGAADALMPPDHQMSSYLLGAESARGFGGGSATEAGRRRSAADR